MVATNSQPKSATPPQLFPSTMWSAVVAAREAPTPQAMEALERLARAYWRPLYHFLRQRGADHHEAADQVQGFFAYLLSRDFLRELRPSRSLQDNRRLFEHWGVIC